MDTTQRVSLGVVLIALGTLVAGSEMLGLLTAPPVVLPVAVLSLAVGTVLVGTTDPAAESGRPV